MGTPCTRWHPLGCTRTCVLHMSRYDRWGLSCGHIYMIAFWFLTLGDLVYLVRMGRVWAWLASVRPPNSYYHHWCCDHGGDDFEYHPLSCHVLQFLRYLLHIMGLQFAFPSGVPREKKVCILFSGVLSALRPVIVIIHLRTRPPLALGVGMLLGWLPARNIWKKTLQFVAA